MNTPGTTGHAPTSQAEDRDPLTPQALHRRPPVRVHGTAGGV